MSKRLKNSPSSLAFASASVEKLLAQINGCDSKLAGQFLALVTCNTTGKDQLAVLKQICKICKDSGGLCEKDDIYVLVSMFMHCAARHPMRRSLTNMFLHVNEEHRGEVVRVMDRMLRSVITIPYEACSVDEIRGNVDTISSLMENFPLGDDVIRRNCSVVLLFLDKSLKVLTNLTRKEQSPMDQTKIMQHTLATLKTILAVLQKCETSAVKCGTSIEKCETSLENREASLGNGETSVENDKTLLKNGETSVENGETSLENGETSLENGETLLENGETSLENGETSLENGETSLESYNASPLQKTNLMLNITEQYTSSMTSIVSQSLCILCDEVLTLECRSTAAIVFPSVFCHIPEQFGKPFIELVFTGYKLVHSDPIKSSESTIRDSNELCAEIKMSSYYSELNGISKILFDSICSFFDSKVQLSSRLVLLHALLVKLPETALLRQLTTNSLTLTVSTLFNKLFIDELIGITLKTCNKNVLVLAFKTITLWIEKACLICTKHSNITITLAEVATDKLLPHLVLYVDHYIDTIRHNVNTAVKACFTLLSSIPVQDFDKCVGSFFNGELSTRGQVAMMINICQFISIKDILNDHKELPGEIVSLLGEFDLANHGCDLYEIMCRKHFKEICEDNNDINEWTGVWIDTLYAKLRDDNKDIKSNIVNLLIPSLLKIHPGIVNDILQDVNANPGLEKVRAVIVFLRCLRGMKNYVNTTGISFDSSLSATMRSHEDHTWKNMIRINDMKKCLTHIDEQVCLDALSLICSSVKTTDPVDKEDIDLLQYFLRFNMASENPSFRHQLITNLKKFCLRLFNHTFQIVKQTTPPSGVYGNTPSTQGVLMMYENFLMWLTHFVFKHLYECAPYSQTSTLLGIVSLITGIFDTNKESKLKDFYIFDEKEKVKFTAILIQCFNDSYDPNRIIAIEIFERFPPFCSFSDVNIKEMFKNNLAELSSPKPDASSVAAYHLAFLAVILNGKDTQFLYDYYSDVKSPVSCFYFSDRTANSSVVMVLLDISLNLLKEQLQIAKGNLIRGCQDAPLYGVLFCMRMMFQLQNFEVKGAGKTVTLFLGDLLETGLEIIKIVSPYVSNDAPEGYLCDVSLLEIFTLLNLSDAGKSNIEVEAHVARMLLVCCWRSMKEVSLLIGIIVSNFSNLTSDVATGDQLSNFLPVPFIIKIWDMFCNILLRSKHAGAYELASLGFIKLCSVLWLSHSEELRSIPGDAVTSLVCDLLDPVPLDKAQVTRRSAGLPFYLEALCITEPLIKHKQSFKSLMTSLTDLCEHKLSQHDVNKIVISLNVLRAFYKNAKLREDVFPFVSSGIVISITGFASSKWAIRNSCTLLFGALMQRIFGVKKSKMTGREFFSRFPRLYSFLLNQAKSINESLDAPCNDDKKLYGSYHPSLFPVLLLLSHLYPSTIETSNSLMRLDNFIPYVMRCGSNAVYKTRTIAAKALVPLVSLEHEEELLTKLLSQIELLFSQNNTNRLDQNYIHGTLLQFKFVLERCSVLPKSYVNLESLFEKLTSRTNVCLDTNVSFVIKSLYVDILTLFLQNGYTGSSCSMLPLCLHCLHLSTKQDSTCVLLPGHALFLRSSVHYVNMLFKFTKESDVLERRILTQLNSTDTEKKVADISDMVALFMLSNDDNVVAGMLDLIDYFINSGRVSIKMCNILFNYMSTMSMKKKYFAKALSTFGLLVRQEDKAYQYAPNILHRILTGISSSFSDEMRTDVVKLIVVFILKLDSKQKVHEDVFDILNKMWKFLENSCNADQCESCREETASVLCLNPQSIIFGSCPNDVYRYFNCCIKLLKDPSSYIRDISAENLHVRSVESYVPNAPLILDILFKEKIVCQVMKDPKQGILYLISLMLNIDLFQMNDWLNSIDLMGVQSTESSESKSNNSELVKRFVVYEESKENPCYDLQEICELSCDVLNRFYTSYEDTHEDTQHSFQNILSRIRTYYDHILRRKNDFVWTYLRQFVK